ncbi:MAG: AraC family transcriptional regulator [Anaerocolumna sp.]
MKNSRKPINLYYCGKEECDPGHYFGPAVRPHFLMHFILNGKGSYQTGEERFELKKGETFLIRPQEITYYEADIKNPWEYAWIAFDGEAAEEMLDMAGITAEKPVCDILKLEDCEKYLKLMAEKFKHPGYHEYELVGLFYLVFSTIARAETRREEVAEQGYYEKALSYIRHNYSYNIRVSDIARYVGIDRTYLFKIFKQYMGKSVKKYLTGYRILSAKYMLTDTNYNMTEVALSCGFYDLPSFCRNFKQQEGMTPVQYRNKMKEN